MFKRTHYLFLIAFTVALSGCRFGNHSEQVVPPPTFLSKELFLTEPDQFEVKARVWGVGNVLQTHTNSSTTLSAVPSSVLATFTNPFYYAVVNNNDKTPVFMSYGEDSYFITKVANDGTIEYDSDEGVELTDQQFMYNPNCRTRVRVITGGQLDRSLARNIPLVGGGSLHIDGEASIEFNVSRAIYGDCQEDLEILASCYATGTYQNTPCSTDLLQFANDLLFLYVDRAGVLDVNDIVNLNSLEYTVFFQ